MARRPALPVSAAKKPTGRPSLYTEDLADEICSRLANGESLTGICADEHMPARISVVQWLLYSEDPKYTRFQNLFARAERLKADVHFDEVLDISDDTSKDWKLVGRNQDREVPDTEVVQRSKLRVETRLKLAKILNPDKYGDKGPPPGEGGEGLALSITIKGGLPDDG